MKESCRVEYYTSTHAGEQLERARLRATRRAPPQNRRQVAGNERGHQSMKLAGTFAAGDDDNLFRTYLLAHSECAVAPGRDLGGDFIGFGVGVYDQQDGTAGMVQGDFGRQIRNEITLV